MTFICPLPIPWNETFRRLRDHWENAGSEGPPPPTPLILAGWAFTNDVEKAARWAETIAWAEHHECEFLLPSLTNDQKYEVEEPSSYQVGPLGGPMYQTWSFERKEVPSQSILDKAMNRLRQNWLEVAGNLAKHTTPISFTGDKARRLLVRAVPETTPPWGDWNRITVEAGRMEFTRFRKAVNVAISPHEVDHIDFEVS